MVLLEDRVLKVFNLDVLLEIVLGIFRRRSQMSEAQLNLNLIIYVSSRVNKRNFKLRRSVYRNVEIELNKT